MYDIPKIIHVPWLLTRSKRFIMYRYFIFSCESLLNLFMWTVFIYLFQFILLLRSRYSKFVLQKRVVEREPTEGKRLSVTVFTSCAKARIYFITKSQRNTHEEVPVLLNRISLLVVTRKNLDLKVNKLVAKLTMFFCVSSILSCVPFHPIIHILLYHSASYLFAQ